MKEEGGGSNYLGYFFISHRVTIGTREEFRYVIGQDPFLWILVYSLFPLGYTSDGMLHQFTFIRTADTANTYTSIDNNRSD